MKKTEIIFGLHTVDVFIKKSSEKIKQLYVQDNHNEKRLEKIIANAKSHGVPLIYQSRHILDEKTHSANHQGLVAEIIQQTKSSDSELDELIKSKKDHRLFLILDGIQDPQNLGACMRTAHCMGVTAIIAPKDKSAPLNATVRKVASGAAELIPYYSVTNLARTLKKMQDNGIWLVGADGAAKQTINEIDLGGSIGLVMGAEGHGIRRLTREHCDFLARIPMAGEIGSYNVSVATGICLYEIIRQRSLR